MISGHLSAPHRIRIRKVKAHRAGGIPPPPQHPHSLGHEISADGKWRYVSTIFLAIFYGMFPYIGLKNRPYIYIYGIGTSEMEPLPGIFQR